MNEQRNRYEEEIDILQYVNVLARHKSSIAIAVVFFVISAFIYTFFIATPVYKANSSLFVKRLTLASKVADVAQESENRGDRNDTTMQDIIQITNDIGFKKQLVNEFGLKNKDGTAYSLSDLLKLKFINAVNIRGTSYIEIYAENEDPVTAKKIADRAAELVLAKEKARTIGSAKEARNFVEKELATTKKEIDDITYKYVSRKAAIVTKYPYIDISKGNKQLADFENRARQTEFDITKLNEEIKALKEKIGTPPQVYHKFYPQWKERLDKAEKTREEMQISLADLKSKISLFRNNIENFNRDKLQLDSIGTELEIAKQKYERMSEAHQEAIIAETAAISNIQISSLANVPDRPIKPNKKMHVLLGFIFGLISSIAYIFTKEAVKHSFQQSENDLQTIFKTEILGQIPLVKGKKTIKEILTINVKENKIYVEAFNSLKAMLKLLAKKEPFKVIGITSPTPDEGKTNTAANLAIAYANEDKKVLLVDGDLRLPSLHTIFDIEPSGKGLSDYLTDEQTIINTIINSSSIKGLNIVTAGVNTDKAIEKLDSKRFDQFAAETKESYDIVIIDTAPLSVTKDSLLLEAKLDGLIMVIDTAIASKNIIKHAKQDIDKANVKLLGIVMGKVRESNMSYFGGYGKYY